MIIMTITHWVKYMASMTSDASSAFSIDHLGIVSAVAKELGLVEKLDRRLPRYDVRRIVSNGNAVLAMILNGLGFSNQRLYLMPQFLANKPIDRLLEPNLKPEHFDDHVLGRTLDEISEYGASKLFVEIAFEIALEQNLLGKEAHIDTTSFSFEGAYSEQSSEPATVNICHGFSKDHRKDLKQVVLNMAVSGPANMPIFMEPLSGNTSDKKSLPSGIDTVRSFQKQLQEGFADFLWIADSALYSKEKLLARNDFFWVSRVPETIVDAKILVAKADHEVNWVIIENGYRYSANRSSYGGIDQHWILVFSEQAYSRERATFETNLAKQDENAKKELWHVSNQIYGCETDANKALEKAMKKFPYHEMKFAKIEPILKFSGKGRPKPEAPKQIVGYKVGGEIKRNDTKIDAELSTKGRFIIASNDISNTDFSGILSSYKNQQKVEQGFRFLKDPWFMADTMFLKSPRRIEALMMVMTLCLMIYNVAQYRLRTALSEEKETLPDQLGKQTSSPTLRWVFQMMEGVILVVQNSSNETIKTIFFNLNALRLKIIRLFGLRACEIYGTA